MTIALDEAIANLPADVQEALRRGEEVILTRHDAPVARIIPFVETRQHCRPNRMTREEMERQAQEAMADPDFVADMREIQRAFPDVDSRNWPVFDSDKSDEKADMDFAVDSKSL